MKLRNLIALMGLLFLCCTGTTRAALVLSSLDDPTVQTLIDLGSEGVTVGPDRFYNFTYVDFSNAGPQNAGDVSVQPLTNGGYGLRFVSGWSASDGNSLTTVITFQVDSTDTSKPIGGVDLFSDGTAPVPAAGTYSSTALTARTTGGTTAGKILTTYEDGELSGSPGASTQDSPVDFSNFAEQMSLTVTDAISAASTSGGVATGSIVENTFVPIPEPMQGGWMFTLTTIAVVVTARRPARRRSAARNS